jgi:hypothetical protein
MMRYIEHLLIGMDVTCWNGDLRLFRKGVDMSFNLKSVLLLLALVSFTIKAFGLFPTAKIDFMNLGFAFVTASFLFG